jgi:hypothetical protein
MCARQDPASSRETIQWRSRDGAAARPHRQTAVARCAGVLALGFALAAPVGAQGRAARPVPVDVQVIVLAPPSGDGTQLSFTYRSPVAKGEPERDLAALAAALRQPVPKARITTESIRAAPKAPGLTSVETSFRGLLDRSKGSASVEPFARVFARFPHVRVTYLVDRAFRLKEPVEDTLGSEVSAAVSGQAPVINVDLWRGAARPQAAMPGRAGARPVVSLALLFVLLAAVAAGVAVYILARAWSGMRPPTADGRPPGQQRAGGSGTGPHASRSESEGSRPGADVEKANARR